MAIKASEGVINKIKELEGFRSKPYPDAKTGKMAVGYGDTDNIAVPLNRTQAEERLKARIKLAEDELNSTVKRQDLTQLQKDTLIDMHYNLGLGNMGGMIETVNSGDDKKAGEDIGKYIHSEDVTTGKKVVIPALVDRAKYRQSMWSSREGNPIVESSKPAEVQTGASFQADEYFRAELEDMASEVIAEDEGPTEEATTFPTTEDIELMADEVVKEEIPVSPVDRKQMLDVTADSLYKDNASNWLMKRSESERISKKLNISMLEARSMLEDNTPEEILSRNANAVTAKYFPAISQWGQQQDNYVLMQKTGDLPRKIEVKSRALNTDGEFEKAFKMNAITLKRSAVHAGMVAGNIGVNEGKAILYSLDQESKFLAPTKNLEIKKKIADSWRGVEEGAKKFQDGSMIEGTFDSVSNYLHVLSLYAGNPSEYAQEIVQSGSSFVPAGLVLLGGALATTGVGAVTGIGVASTGVALSGLMSFGERMDETLNDFKDANGNIDYDAAFSDPDRVSGWRTESSIYAGVMAGSDLVLGQVGKKIAVGAKGVIGKVKKVAIASVVEEAGSQFAASGSADLYAGKFVERLPKNITSALQEATISPGFSIAGAAGARASSLAISETRKNASKLMSKLKSSAKAKDSADSMKQTRSDFNTNLDMAQAKSQSSDLINETTASKQNPSDIYTEDSDVPTDIELKAKDNMEAKGTITFSPSEFDEFVSSKGFDPAVVIQNLSPEIQDSYNKNKDSDNSVIVSMGEWLTFQEDDALDGIDDIARFPDSFINGNEAKENIDDVGKKPLEFLQTNLPPIPDEAGELPPPVPGELPPPVPGERPTDMVTSENLGPVEIIEPTQAEGNIVSRPVQLISKFRSASQQSVMKKVLAAVKRAASLSKDIDPKSLDAIAEIQYNHNRFRAEVLGIPVKDLMTMKFAQMPDEKSIVFKDGVKYEVKGSFASDLREGRLPEAVTKIMLAKGANLPTLIHELGHSWLHDMLRDSDFIYGLNIEDLTPLQSEYKTAMKNVAEMYGLKDIREIFGMDDKAVTRVHEKFAQTSEKYFLEGTFENNAIKAVMESLRKYIVHLANSIGMAYPHFGSFKIDPKVEKLFETILGASQKVEDAVVPLIEPPMFDPKMLGADGPKYQEILADVENEAMATTYGKSILNSERKREAEGIKRLAEFRAKAELEVDAQPAFALLKHFKDAYAEYVKTGQGTDPRFSFESVVETLFQGDEEGAMKFKKQIPMQVISGKKKGGVNIVGYMVENGIFDPQTMASALAEMTNREMRIDEVVDSLIDEAMPTIKTDEEIHAIAEDAVQSQKKEDRIAFEMKILATKYLPTLKGIAAKLINPARYFGKEAKADIQITAHAKVMSSPASGFRAKTFLVDSDRKGRASSKAFKSNDIQLALEEKYKQMINFKSYEYAKSAFNMMARTDKAVKKIVKYAGRKEAVHYFDVEVLNQGKRMIKESSTGKISHMPFGVINEASGVTPDMVKDINFAVDTYNSLSHGAPVKLNNVSARIALGETLNRVLRASSAARKIEIAGEKAEVNSTAINFASEVSEYQGSIEFRSKEGIMARRKKDVTPIRWLFEGLLGNKYENSTAFSLIGDITNSEAVGAIEKRKIKNEIVEAYKPLIKKDKGLALVFGPILKRTTPEALQKAVGITEAPIIAAELGMAFRNTGELLKAMLLMGSESGAINFLRRNTTVNLAYNIDTGAVDRTKYNEFIQRSLNDGTINAGHIEFVNTVWGVFNRLHPEIDKVMREVDGFHIGKIQGTAQSFSLDGKAIQLNGGYAPISVEADLKTPTADSKFLTLDAHGISALGLQRQSTNITKERTGGQDPIDLDLSTLSSYTNSAVDIINLRKPLSNFRKVMLHPAVKEAMDAKAPGAMKEVISPWFQRTVSQAFTEYSTDLVDRLARKARKGANMAMYALNTFSGLRQLFGTLQTLRRIEPSYVKAAATQLILKKNALKNAVLKESAFMQERYDTSIKEGHRSIEQLELISDWVTKSSDISQQVASFLSQSMQQYVDLVTWQAAFLKSQDNGDSREQSRNIADDLVLKTQGSMATSALSNLQSGTDAKKFLMMATNIPLINLADLGLQFDMNKTSKETAKGVAGVVAISIVAPVFLEEMIQRIMSEMFPGADEGEDEEEKEKKENRRLAAKVVGNIGSTLVPVVGRFVESAALYNQPSLGPGFNVITKGVQAASGLKNLGRGVNMNYREKRALLDTATFLSGRPEFSMISRGAEFNNWLKTDAEKEEEKYTRQYQLEDLREDLY